MALQSAGLLCTLIFVISSIFEVVSINHLYGSQQGLIALLLGVLAIWALVEVMLISRRDRSQPLRSLRLLLLLQIGLVTARHWQHIRVQPRHTAPLAAPLSLVESSQALVFLSLYLLLFLAISRSLIQAFAAGERQRTRQLQQQNQLLLQTQEELRAVQAQQQRLEQQQRAQLEHKLKTSLTAAAVVHEIQQPLSAILLRCRSASHWLDGLSSASVPEHLRASLDQLSGDGEQVVATMERMRMLLRNVETQHAPIDLTACIHSGLLVLKNDLAEAQVQPQLEGLERPCRLDGDAAQLQVAVVNLIRNALQAMQQVPPGHRLLLLSLERRHDGVELHVADSGPGFPPSYRNDTSWELLKSTKASGMGIGLFIAQTAATNHRGLVRIGRSERCGGAEVVIELPRLSPGAAEESAAP